MSQYADMDQAIVFCKGNIEKDGKLLYLPLYMTGFLENEYSGNLSDIVYDGVKGK